MTIKKKKENVKIQQDRYNDNSGNKYKKYYSNTYNYAKEYKNKNPKD